LIRFYETENKWKAGEDFNVSGMIGGWTIFNYPLSEAKRNYYHLGCAASITGYVRAYLWRHIKACRDAGIDVLYCDTDSIMTNAPAEHIFAIGEELGQWDCEFTGDYAAIGGKKLYAFRGIGDYAGKWKIGSKGARLTAQQIVKVAKGEEVRWKNDAPTYKLIPQSSWKDGERSNLTYLERTIRSTK